MCSVWFFFLKDVVFFFSWCSSIIGLLQMWTSFHGRFHRWRPSVTVPALRMSLGGRRWSRQKVLRLGWRPLPLLDQRSSLQSWWLTLMCDADSTRMFWFDLSLFSSHFGDMYSFDIAVTWNSRLELFCLFLCDHGYWKRRCLLYIDICEDNSWTEKSYCILFLFLASEEIWMPVTIVWRSMTLHTSVVGSRLISFE